MTRRIALLWVLVLSAPVSAQPNPYGVAGTNWATNGVMDKLGMPGGANDLNGSLAYVWDRLQETNPVNMVRPRRYWEYVGADPERIQGYDHINDELSYPEEFGQWVLDHPDTIWIIGNEPDMGAGQDGLTPAEYARMFHTFHVFIREEGHDPTAKFATAGLGALAYTSWLNDDIAWWNDALAEYQLQFGADMPINIWNSHCYALAGSLDPDYVINVYFQTFMDYTRTVNDGVYADTEFWVTEFGQGLVGQEIGAEYMKQICPRLEAIGVDRFFWFMGPWAENFQDSVLTGPAPDRVPTLLGETYASLAGSYPNPIPPPSPLQMPFEVGPARAMEDFEGTETDWRVGVGNWSIEEGTYRQTRMACWMWSYWPYDYADVRISADVKINAATDPQGWVAISVRNGFVWDDGDYKTYTAYLRQNGELALWSQQDDTVASEADVVADTSQYHRLSVLVVGSHFEISVDGQAVIEWDDPNGRRSAGIMGLRTCKADASFDNVDVRLIVPADQDMDGDVDQADFGLFQGCFSGPGSIQSASDCARACLDDDDDVDLDDFGLFQQSMTGAFPE